MKLLFIQTGEKGEGNHLEFKKMEFNQKKKKTKKLMACEPDYTN